MSECVVRMEMPKNCFECPFSIIDDTADGAWCNALAQQVYCTSDGRDEDCPIICALPEGHGRLVDADALNSILEHRVREGFTIFTVRDIVEASLQQYSPTIVPAERREE